MDLFGQGIRHRLRNATVAGALVLGACQHGDPFPSGDPGSKVPFQPGELVQLTLSPWDDLTPSWLPDGSAFGYRFHDVYHQGDRCIGVLPASGGSRRTERCPTNDFAGDSLDALSEVAFGPEGQVAWVESHTFGERVASDRGGIAIGRLSPRVAAPYVQPLPYRATSGNLHFTATHLRWLHGDRLAYIGTEIQFVRACNGCPLDSIAIGREIMVLNLATPGAAPSVLPGTSAATSLWPTADSSGVYFTVAGDSRIWKEALTGGPAELVHDFGAAGITRDVSVVGDRLAAIVGGEVAYGEYPPIGLRQADRGGPLYLLDLVTGSLTVIDPPGLGFRRGVLSPDGSEFVAEGFVVDQLNPDIWKLALP